MTNASTAAPTRPTRAQLVREVRAVAADLPLLLTAPLYRGWHCRWGATPAELASSLPGDDMIPHAQYRCTRSVTVDAPAAAVWPWLVQVGCLRGGFYSNDLLDNLGRPSARQVIPELQRLEIGQWVPMSPTPSEGSAFKVDGYEANRWLLWRKSDSTWAWLLTDLGDGKTRLVTRVRALYDWSRPGWVVLGVLLMEFGDFAMMRRMLRGIKERAEEAHRGTAVG